MKDYYKILELQKSATEVQVKKAYRRMALRWHPDVNNESNASQRFKEINEAYSILGNSKKRRHYDFYNGDSANGIDKKYYEGGGKKYGTAYKKYPDANTNTGKTSYYRKREPTGDFKIMENMMFYSLMLIGCIAIVFAVKDLFDDKVEGIDGLSGIIFGLTFTGLLAYSWRRIYRKKQAD